MTDIWQWNATRTAAEAAAGTISAREITQAHIDRLDAVNPSLNAVTNDVREEALETAARLDAQFAESGPVGPLHGVPITIKENIDVAGQATPNGLPVAAELIAADDSPLVAHFKAAGAVIVGRTNTPEMSYRWHTKNPLRGETKNPWSANRTPGGSSGGAAASVAAGVGTIAHGNDLGGSVRQPANCCGLVGLRPSLGRVPAHNHTAAGDRTLALQLMSVQGPLARELADARLGFEIMMQPDPHDPWHRAAPYRPADAKPGPVAVAVSYGTSESATDPEVRKAIDESASHLEASGYNVTFIDPPRLDEIREQWRQILATETAVALGDDLWTFTSDEFKTCVNWMFEDSILDLAGYVQALALRATILRDWHLFLDQYPLVLMPVSQRVPFGPNADAANRDSFLDIYLGHTSLVAVNYLGLPGLAVPVTQTPDGPIGIQLVGRPFREDQCFDAGAVIEQHAGVMAPHLWASDSP